MVSQPQSGMLPLNWLGVHGLTCASHYSIQFSTTNSPRDRDWEHDRHDRRHRSLA